MDFFASKVIFATPSLRIMGNKPTAVERIIDQPSYLKKSLGFYLSPFRIITKGYFRNHKKCNIRDE